MAQLDALDIVVLIALLVGTVAYFTKGIIWSKKKDTSNGSLANGNGAKSGKSRNLLEKLESAGKNCVVFYGSQTGTAEDYASRLAKEGSSRFGLKTMVADLEDYDYDNINELPEETVVFFVLATYGEGEPTDNAVEFHEFITADSVAFDNGANEEKPLKNLKWVGFGLGNNTYEHYNAMIRIVDKALDKLGATRISEAGEGDDGAGTMEEDFLAWKEPMWEALAKEMNLEEREAVYEPTFEVNEKSDASEKDNNVYLGEHNRSHLENKVKGPYNAHNPYLAPISQSRELFKDKSRNCLHMELDVSGSSIRYSTGDHVAIWPTNPGREVDRFLQVLGLESRRDTVVSIKGLDPSAKIPFMSPTTYGTIFKHFLEICNPVSRQLVATLAQFAPNDSLKKELEKLGGDKEYFSEKVASKNYNLGQFLEQLGKGEQWTKVPFSLWVESLTKMQPRFYSISSSSRLDKDKITVTAVVDSIEKEGTPVVVKGITTNLLLALKHKQHNESDKEVDDLKYDLSGPRGKYEGLKVPIYVRHSNFKLPSDPRKPIVMVGPGTGVAPFRAFVQERAAVAKEGKEVGKTILFFGCRKKDEDYIYEDEWEEYKKDLGDSFEMHTAFSREGKKKVYVQDKMKELASEIDKVFQQKGYFYLCGDAASMAREVNSLVGKIIQEQRGISESEAEEQVKKMKASNLFQEDVWS